LGGCYEKGQGVAKDETEAVKWYRKAAEQNDPDAQYNLGLCYTKGQGVTEDYVEASAWLLLAVWQGVEAAREVVNKLELVMSRAQVAEGQKLARGFKPRELPASGATG
jgi:hypothetical protein